MRVAVLFSGGKDSVMSLYHALNKGWNVVALIAVKPKNTEAYLWHFATVEWTLLSAEAIGIPLFLIKSDKIGPEKEAKELEKVFERIKIDALLLGGVGLQKVQIEAVRKVAKKFGVKVLVPHEGLDHYQLIKDAIEAGFDIRITQVAVDGMGQEWLGRRLDLPTLEQLKQLSEKFGFHVGGEGGSYDTLVIDGPIFKYKIELSNMSKIWLGDSGYLKVNDAHLTPK